MREEEKEGSENDKGNESGEVTEIWKIQSFSHSYDVRRNTISIYFFTFKKHRSNTEST